jgi:hypothetical protein
MWFLRLLTADVSAGRIEEEGETIYLATEATQGTLLPLYLQLQGRFVMAEKNKTRNAQEIPLKRVPLICTDCGCDLGRSSADQIFLLKDKVYCRGCKANYLHAKSLEDLTVNSLKSR